jgi:hypothetical protein
MRKAKIYEGTIYNGVVIDDLLYVDGDVLLGHKRIPNFAVVVAKQGTCLHGVRGIEGEFDLGWVKLIGAGASCLMMGGQGKKNTTASLQKRKQLTSFPSLNAGQGERSLPLCLRKV